MAKAKTTAALTEMDIAKLLSEVPANEATNLLARAIEVAGVDEKGRVRMNLVQLFKSFLTPLQSATIREHLKKGDTALAFARLDQATTEGAAKRAHEKEMLGLRQEGRIGEKSIDAVERRELEELRLKSRLALKEAGPGIAAATTLEKGRAELELEKLRVRAAEEVAAPAVAGIRSQLEPIRSAIEGRAKEVPVEDFRARLLKLKEAAQGQPFTTVASEIASTEAALDSRVADASNRTKLSLQRAGITDASALAFVDSEIQKRGLAFNPKAERDVNLLRRAGNIQLTNQGILRSAAEQGVTVRAPGGQIPSEGEFLVRKPGFLSGGRAIGQAETVLRGLGGEAAAGTPASGLIERAQAALQRAGKAPGRSKATAAAIGIPLLLMSLLKGKQEPQGMNPMMQAQLMQLMGTMQNEGQLAESKALSNRASAEQALAKAALLRMQAMQAGGGQPAFAF
jgi:hypothetical protein